MISFVNQIYSCTSVFQALLIKCAKIAELLDFLNPKSSKMATSQSLASIMEQMVTKVMEDAVSTSIIYTQAQNDESAKKKVWFEKSMSGQ